MVNPWRDIWIPVEGAVYRYDYGQWLNAIADSWDSVFILKDGKSTYPQLIGLIRKASETSFLFFVFFILGHSYFHTAWHVARMYELQDNSDMTLDLWPRETGKSTLGTQDYTMWKTLKDPECVTGILSYNKSLAKSHLFAIKTAFESNDLMKKVWSDVLYEKPDRESPRWSLDEGIIVKRKSVRKEGSIEAGGLIDGMPTGKHFDLVFDDIVTPGNIGTPEQIEKTSEMFQMGLNLGRKGGTVKTFGTIYHFADQHVKMEKSGDWVVHKYPVPDEGIPGWWTAADVKKKRILMGRNTFASQMKLNPIADGIKTFDLGWMRYFDSVPTDVNKYIIVDPAGSKNKRSDYTVMWVVAFDAEKNMYILDCVRDRLLLRERWEELLKLVQKWSPMNVGYEKYGIQADIEYIKEKQGETNQYFTLTPLAYIPEAEGKNRIMLLQPNFEAGKIFFPRYIPGKTLQRQVDLVETFIKEEFLEHPFPSHDDMLDCLSRAYDPELCVVYPMRPRSEVYKHKPFDYFNTGSSRQNNWRNL